MFSFHLSTSDQGCRPDCGTSCQVRNPKVRNNFLRNLRHFKHKLCLKWLWHAADEFSAGKSSSLNHSIDAKISIALLYVPAAPNVPAGSIKFRFALLESGCSNSSWALNAYPTAGHRLLRCQRKSEPASCSPHAQSTVFNSTEQLNGPTEYQTTTGTTYPPGCTEGGHSGKNDNVFCLN